MGSATIRFAEARFALSPFAWKSTPFIESCGISYVWRTPAGWLAQSRLVRRQRECAGYESP